MPAAPLKENSPWVSKDGSIEIPYEEVCDNMSEIGTELAMLQMSMLLFSCLYHSNLYPCFIYMVNIKYFIPLSYLII